MQRDRMVLPFESFKDAARKIQCLRPRDPAALKYGDGDGLLWQVAERESRGSAKAADGSKKPRPVVQVVRAEMPACDWRPPTELPSLRGVKRLCIDIEGRI